MVLLSALEATNGESCIAYFARVQLYYDFFNFAQILVSLVFNLAAF